MWFEDVPLGTKLVLGSYTFTEDTIVAFARKYDPQPFHIDPKAAAASPYGGIIASGWHTAAVWMKLMVTYREKLAVQTGGEMPNRFGVSPGFRDMRWFKPVRPGMTLIYSTEPTDKLPWPSRPELGLLESRNEARDEQGELMMSFVGRVLLLRKPKA
jgi:acyl dehydratase